MCGIEDRGGLNAFPLLPGCRIARIGQGDPTTLQLEAHGVRDGARCPACGVWSGAGHGSYQRQPADLPRLGKIVQSVLRGRRFCCHNVACARRTFAERLPGWLVAYARRPRRLEQRTTRVAWKERFPGFGGINYARRAKPGAYVLARTHSSNPSRNDLVLFAVQNIGRGRTMAFMSDTAEAWGTDFERSWGDATGSNRYYRKFWNNTIRWLAADRIAQKSGQSVIELPDTPVLPGDLIPLRVASLSAGELTELAVSVQEAGQVRAAPPEGRF